MRKTPFIPGEYYHIYNRTILNIPEFKEKNNCNRLMQAFLLANSTKSSQAFEYLRNNSKPTYDVGFTKKNGQIYLNLTIFALGLTLLFNKF